MQESILSDSAQNAIRVNGKGGNPFTVQFFCRYALFRSPDGLEECQGILAFLRFYWQ
jgi:hypothetical protein